MEILSEYNIWNVGFRYNGYKNRERIELMEKRVRENFNRGPNSLVLDYKNKQLEGH